MKLAEFLTIDLKEKFGVTKDETWHEVEEKLKREKCDSEYEEVRSMRDCFLIQEIFKRHPDVLGRHLDDPCPKCGAEEVYCGHIDLGRADYDDHF